ncbi:hypothetical protein AB0V39_27995 [Mesorhizobium ciceri]
MVWDRTGLVLIHKRLEARSSSGRRFATG